MSDIDPTVQGFIEQANTAEARGLHSERAAAATAGLAAMAAAYNPAPSATPTNSVEAGKRLEYLNKDASWRNRVFSGDVAARREFDALNAAVAAGDPVELAMAGITPPPEVDENAGAVADGSVMVAAAKQWATFGVPDNDIAHALADGKYSAKEYALAQRVQAEALSDKNFVEKWKAGNPKAQRIMWACSAVLAAGIDPVL